LSQNEPHEIVAPAEPEQNEPANPVAEPSQIYARSNDEELRQGEIITDLPELRLNIARFIETGEAVVDIEVHPYAIVVSQDCDLMQDYFAKRDNLAPDKILPNILFCEATTAQLLRGREDINSNVWRPAVNNKNERYHVLESVPADSDALGVGLPALGVDFKRYFSLPRDETYHRITTEAHRRCRLLNPYLEHFCTRFFYFQYRVALPTDHQVKV
jgi:hypothetical protein